MGGDYFMLRQEPPQRDWSTLVEQYAHSGNSQGAPRRVLQHGANLLECDAGKPLNELRDERAVLEVLEERRHRYAGAAKYPGTTYAFGIAFNGRTGRPIEHALLTTTGPEEAANVEVRGTGGGERLRREASLSTARLRLALVVDSVIMPGIDPHRFSLASSPKAEALIEIYGSTICNQHQLMKVFVLGKKSFHHLAPDTFTLMVWMNEHVGKVHDQMTIRDCIADAHKRTRYACGD